jgi:hypothetical protein
MAEVPGSLISILTMQPEQSTRTGSVTGWKLYVFIGEVRAVRRRGRLCPTIAYKIFAGELAGETIRLHERSTHTGSKDHSNG